MKKLFKTLAALAVVAALGFGFVSCGGGDDDSSSGGGGSNSNSALAVFTCNSGNDTRTLTFYNDSTFKVIVSDESEPQAAGTYKFVSGDWENGTISLNATSGEKQETFTGTKTISEKKIIFSSKTYTLTGGSLKTPSESTASETKKDDTTKPADESGDSGNSGTTKTDTPTTATVSATFKGKVSGFEAEQIFYSDNTYLTKVSGTDKYKGNYKLTGTWDSGSVTLSQTHEFKGGKWVEAKETSAVQIVNGKADLGNGDSLTKVAATDTTETAKEYKDNSTYKVRDAKTKGKIGDVLLNDGTVVSYKEGMTFTDEQKKKAVCVLACFNDKKEPVGLGLHNSADGTNSNSGKYKWTNCDNKDFTDIVCNASSYYSGYVDTVTFTGDTDGSDNWAYICSADPEGSANAAENYPAFDYVNNYAATFGLTGTYASGWYMPSIAELCYIYRNRRTVNAVLEALGGTEMASDYWSSSQTTSGSSAALFLHFSSGTLYYYSKYYGRCVCCVRAFSN